MRLVAVASVVAAAGLWFYGRQRMHDSQAIARGEEVYASHDCTDCHLALHILRQKKEKGEPGLLRRRTNEGDLLDFLTRDARHQSWTLISEADREDLLAFLKSLRR